MNGRSLVDFATTPASNRLNKYAAYQDVDNRADQSLGNLGVDPLGGLTAQDMTERAFSVSLRDTPAGFPRDVWECIIATSYDVAMRGVVEHEATRLGNDVTGSSFEQSPSLLHVPGTHVPSGLISVTGLASDIQHDPHLYPPGAAAEATLGTVPGRQGTMSDQADQTKTGTVSSVSALTDTRRRASCTSRNVRPAGPRHPAAQLSVPRQRLPGRS
ncbi:hypothetical protein B0H21DRAFT_746948 [Amylocystis lapponica]|nr:hypothetical protein B0H21DRAFT_746948 [Amylocystis lapponica]